jgi:MtN3 and saliva related transmembrane protein
MFPPSELLMTFVGTVMALAGIPQAYRIWSRKSSEDISLMMYSIFVFGQFFWIAYGAHMTSPCLVISNSVALLVNSTIVVLSLRFRHRN